MKGKDQEKDDLEFLYEEIPEDENESEYRENRKPARGEKSEAEYEADYDEEFDELDDDSISINPKLMPFVFGGMVVLAVIICALLWMLTHRGQENRIPGNDAENSIESIENSIETDVETTVGTDGETTPDETASKEMTSEAATTGDAGEDGQPQNSGEENNPGTVHGEGAEVPAEEPVSGTTGMEFTEVADSVTAKDVTNLRSVPSTADAENVVTQLQNGETLSRTGVNDSTGWSRLDYNGQTVYAVTQYLTTDLTYKPPVVQGDPNRVNTQDGRVIIFVDCDDEVTPKEYVNLRVEPSTSQGQSTVNCQVSNGTNVHRTGYSPDSGWSRVEYNGTTLYVVSSLVNVVTEQ